MKVIFYTFLYFLQKHEKLIKSILSVFTCSMWGWHYICTIGGCSLFNKLFWTGRNLVIVYSGLLPLYTLSLYCDTLRGNMLNVHLESFKDKLQVNSNLNWVKPIWQFLFIADICEENKLLTPCDFALPLKILVRADIFHVGEWPLLDTECKTIQKSYFFLFLAIYLYVSGENIYSNTCQLVLLLSLTDLLVCL